ncbi:hypothetical protein BJ138DRAFT_1017377 [Hygrophoropsis aurantiaca]|uniref:Uncharacterized protein n=1 Tax=Hygrophoropsis aurantiaca TaxID=72124 RepID=A0ACB7ZX29_9AGAM|nr:hypothetical protein BJ138DRAFT_1017377 [Hygrophoropsis aurantiaca]
MDSTTTLVNIAPPTEYFISGPTLKDAIVYDHHSRPLYFVTSDLKHMVIKSAESGRTIAVWNRRDLLLDTVAFSCRNGGLPIHVSKWMKKTKLRDGTPAFVMDTEWGPYVWKIISSHRHKLYTDFDATKSVASVTMEPKSSSSYRALVIESMAEPIRDDIIVSYLIQRQRLLVEEKAIDLYMGAARF